MNLEDEWRDVLVNLGAVAKLVCRDDRDLGVFGQAGTSREATKMKERLRNRLIQ